MLDKQVQDSLLPVVDISAHSFGEIDRYPKRTDELLPFLELETPTGVTLPVPQRLGRNATAARHVCVGGVHRRAQREREAERGGHQLPPERDWVSFAEPDNKAMPFR